MYKDTRSKIIEFSYQLFLIQGYKQTTTKKIAVLSGVNESTIFRIFGNKQTLFYQSIAHYTADILRINNDGLTYGENIEQDLYTLIKKNMDLIKQTIPAFRLLVKNSLIEDKFLNQIDIKFHNLESFFKQYLIGMQLRGLIKATNFQALVEFLFGIIFHEALDLSIKEAEGMDYHADLDDFCKKYASYCFNLLKLK
jgi:AcrR family transcriptional regulator